MRGWQVSALKNYCEAMMPRWKPAKNAHLLFVNSAFSPTSALPDRLSLRFSTGYKTLVSAPH
jgi:hypothetical protein